MKRTQDGYYTLPCADGCWRGWYTYGSIRRFWLLHNWWKHGDAFKPRRCVPCKGTGRVIVTLARPTHRHIITRHVHPDWNGHDKPCDRPHWHFWWRHPDHDGGDA